jgi:hypothetical protein
MGRYDFWVLFTCPVSSVEGCILCAGEGTATALAEIKRQQGFANVRVATRRDHLYKRPTHDVLNSSIPGDIRRRRVH